MEPAKSDLISEPLIGGPLLTLVTDELHGYVYVLSPRENRLDAAAKAIVRQHGGEFGHDWPGLPCSAWRLPWRAAQPCTDTLHRTGYRTAPRPLSDYAPRGRSLLECPGCRYPRHRLATVCPRCGNTDPPTVP